LRAELRFSFNGKEYGVAHINSFSEFEGRLPTGEQKRIIEQDLIRQIARLIVDKCNIVWDDGKAF
jgi:hypothetical protein